MKMISVISVIAMFVPAFLLSPADPISFSLHGAY